MWIVGVLLLIVASGGLAARYVDSQRQSVLVTASLAPVLMAASLPATVLLFVDSVPLGFIGVVIMAACAATRIPLYRRREPGNTYLTVMQANILLGKADPTAVVGAVDRLKVDVLTVVELTHTAVDGFAAAGLDERLPYRYISAKRGGEGSGIWSRYPLADTQRHDGFITELLSATVDIPDLPPTTIVAVHPVPPWPRNPAAWFRELGMIRELLGRMSDDPVIVSGDFNATHDHKRFRDLLGTRFRHTASGVLRTYSADAWYPAIIGIDHIVVAGGVSVGAGTVPLPGSDHRGVWARISLSSN